MAAGAFSGMDLWGICMAGAGTGGGRAVQRGGIYSGAEDQGVWDTNGAWSAGPGCAANCVSVCGFERGGRNCGGFAAERGVEFGDGEVGGGEFARSGDSVGGGWRDGVGGRVSVRDSGKERGWSGSNGGVAL